MAHKTMGQHTELKFETVILQLENVLAETVVFEAQAWEKVAIERGVFDVDWEEQARSHLDEEIAERILKNSKRSGDTEQNILAEKEVLYARAVQAITLKDLLPGIVPLLQAFTKNGVKIVSASIREHASDIVEKLEIGDFIDHVMDRADLINEASQLDPFVTTVKKSIAIIDNRLNLFQDVKHLFIVGVGRNDPVGDVDAVVKHTGELTYEGLKEQFKKKA